MRVIVTGATGFIGHALVDALLERGDQAVALTRNAQQARQNTYGGRHNDAAMLVGDDGSEARQFIIVTHEPQPVPHASHIRQTAKTALEQLCQLPVGPCFFARGGFALCW